MATIAKTRQPSAICARCRIASRGVFDPEVGRARGVLMPPPAEGRLRHARRRPPADLAEWIEHFWSVSWDLRGCDPFLQQTLPHPNVHIIFDAMARSVAGVTYRPFSTHARRRVARLRHQVPTRWLSAISSASPSATLDRSHRSDRDRSLEPPAPQWECRAIALSEDEDAQIATASEFLRARLPEPMRMSRWPHGWSS